MLYYKVENGKYISQEKEKAKLTKEFWNNVADLENNFVWPVNQTLSLQSVFSLFKQAKNKIS
jgi:hypothetical protein